MRYAEQIFISLFLIKTVPANITNRSQVKKKKTDVKNNWIPRKTIQVNGSQELQNTWKSHLAGKQLKMFGRLGECHTCVACSSSSLCSCSQTCLRSGTPLHSPNHNCYFSIALLRLCPHRNLFPPPCL